MFARSTRMFTVGAIAVLALALAAQAAVYGQNDYLTANKGKAYIPLMPSTSGTLGDFNGSRVIGGQPDSVTLSKGQSSSGYLVYDLTFDLSSYLLPGGGEPIAVSSDDIDTTQPLWLTLTLFDLDFKPLTGSGRTYFETLAMELVYTGEGYSAFETIPSITIDQNNYGLYREDGFGETDKQQVDYTINLLDPEGMNLSNADLDQILTDMSFTLRITMTSYLEQTGAGRFKYTNTKEYLGDYSAGSALAGGEFDTNALEFAFIPEPASLSLLALSGLALLRRKA